MTLGQHARLALASLPEGEYMTVVKLKQARHKCRGNEATPCAELGKEEKVQLLKVIHWQPFRPVML